MTPLLLPARTGRPDPGPKPVDSAPVVVTGRDDSAPPDTAGDHTAPSPSPVGAVPPTGPPDQDGDGCVPARAGGDVCDHWNDWIHPGAKGYSDGVDQDCDGDPRRGASCSPPVPASAQPALLIGLHEPGPRSRGIVPELTGDGGAELVVTTQAYTAGWLYAGGRLPREP